MAVLWNERGIILLNVQSSVTVGLEHKIAASLLNSCLEATLKKLYLAHWQAPTCSTRCAHPLQYQSMFSVSTPAVKTILELSMDLVAQLFYFGALFLGFIYIINKWIVDQQERFWWLLFFLLSMVKRTVPKMEVSSANLYWQQQQFVLFSFCLLNAKKQFFCLTFLPCSSLTSVQKPLTLHIFLLFVQEKCVFTILYHSDGIHLKLITGLPTVLVVSSQICGLPIRITTPVM